MKAILFLLGLGLGSQLSMAEQNHVQPRDPHPKPKVVDLDFSEASEDVPASGTGGPQSRIPAWGFWAIGATVAASGIGIGWYWHEESSDSPANTRHEQVFTDAGP
jgi:hypothetical protein